MIHERGGLLSWVGVGGEKCSDEDALGPSRQQALKAGLTDMQWRLAEIVVAFDDEDVSKQG